MKSCAITLQGARITYQGEQSYIFDLSAHEAWNPTTVMNGKRKAGKRILPEEWADSFGTPVEEHDAFTNIDPSKVYQGTDFKGHAKLCGILETRVGCCAAANLLLMKASYLLHRRKVRLYRRFDDTFIVGTYSE